MALDSTDKRILALLQQNARIGFAAIGRDIGLSRTAVQERVAKLENAQVIQGYHAQITAESSGLVSAMLFIQIADRPCDPALNWLSGLKDVQKVTSLSGEIDAIAECTLPTAADLSTLIDTIGGSDLIADCRASVVLNQRRKL
ncbi:MAG: Lrp/AsnC family transcriptional regulator [Cognatishimia sp.]